MRADIRVWNVIAQSILILQRPREVLGWQDGRLRN